MTKPTLHSIHYRKIKRPHLWMLCLPFLWQVAAVPWANAIHYTPLGLPFPLVWQMLGVIFSSIIFAVIFHLDRHVGVEREELAFLQAQIHAKLEKPL
ncbi:MULTISPECIES: DUF3311 domain-containing protein [unclassified Serratia (in: enterobacteria)]|uniref:DUF3311 domain-containing protein n=1 Tax=unclassified Serratia (in: enterobacteria) TaxID=2647522 RepID=UPI0005026179|nr:MULTISPECIES: DUF3311 domain-containing protein [unclassified Serratia (in: enterobacteria)]KFK95695.1 hypothetical protein JV45_06900 [Serratia sp. Ag2]KFK95961.1 hypothetical protein IV04_19720 [Serratia sp. Ag1]